MGGRVDGWGWFWEKSVKVVGDEEDQNTTYEILKELILIFLNIPQPWCIVFLRAKKLGCA